MTDKAIPTGALFYGQTRRRKTINFDDELRMITLKTAVEARNSIDTGTLPSPVFEPRRCNACSLAELCRPEAPRVIGPDWLSLRISRAGVPE